MSSSSAFEAIAIAKDLALSQVDHTSFFSVRNTLLNGGTMKKKLLTLAAALMITFGGVAFSATPLAPATPKAEASYFNSCHQDLDGSRWCYRSGCTFFETLAYGCYTGWVRVNTWSA
jgi:hypothetical protein